MTQMKQTHKNREQTYGCQGGWGAGERWIGIWGLADANYYM